MSYKYGTNGNDLNWDMVMFLHTYTEELELAIFNGEAELDEDGNVTDQFYEGLADSNPTVVYYKSKDGKELDIQNLLANGEKIDNYCEWYIVHDTNDNFVNLVGEVPDDYLREEYIAERNEAEGE
jgi:hypothetical protein